MKVRIFIVSVVAILYTVFVSASFYLKIDFLLFILTVPWCAFITLMSGIFMHEPISFDYWFFAGAFVNLMFFLWFFLFRPMLYKSFDVSD